MPISHLLSDSFYLEQEEQCRQVSKEPRFASHRSLPAHCVTGKRNNSIAMSTPRQVTFDEDEKYFDDEYFKDTGMESTRDHIDLAQISPTAIYSPTIYEDADEGHTFNFPEQRKQDLSKEFSKLNMKQTGRSEHFHSANPVLIDTDGGIYDAWALSLALSHASTRAQGNKIPMTDFHLVGITTVNGSTSVINAVRNVQRVFQESGNVPPVPIFKGMESSLIGQKGNTSIPAFFGSDGFGDPKDLPPLESHNAPAWIEKDHAVNAIIKLAEMYKGRLTIIALGPLTNLAMAVKLKPEIRNYIKEIFIFGGNVDGVGNMTVSSEFNFFVDPEAANITLASYHSCPIYLLPWETCIGSAASSLAFRTNIIGKLGTPLVNLFNKIEGSILKKHGDQWTAPEAVIMACFLNREVMSKTENHYCTVELQGKHTRGMMVVDRNFRRQHPANVTLITEVDRTALENMLIEAMAMTMNEGGDIPKQNAQNHLQEHSNEHRSRTMFKIEQNYF